MKNLMKKIDGLFRSMEKSSVTAKIISLICAILLWFFVMNVVDPVTRRSFHDVPVRIEGIQDLRRRGLTLIDGKEIQIDLELQGNRSYMDQVNSSNIQAFINLEGLSKGQQSVPIQVTNYNDNVRVVGQDPTNAVITIDENTSVREKVEVKTIGDLPEGYIMGEVNKNIKYARVSGPKSKTDSIHSIVAYVNVKNRRETTVISSELEALDGNLKRIRGLNIDPASLEVEIPIYKTKTVPIVPQMTGTSGQNFQEDAIDIQPKTVTIKGDSAVVNEIQEVKTKPISWTRLEEGTLSTIELEKPEGVGVINSDQIYQVSLRKTRQEEKTVKISNPNIRFSNLDKGLQGQILSPLDELKVRLNGDAQRIDELNVDNMKFYVDGQGLKKGEYNLQIKMTPIEGVHVLKIEPDRIKISLDKD